METHDSLIEIPEIYSTKNEKSQYFVIDSIKKIFMNNDKINLPCSLNDGLETMSIINNALTSQN